MTSPAMVASGSRCWSASRRRSRRFSSAVSVDAQGLDTRRLWIWSRNRMFSARTSFHAR